MANVNIRIGSTVIECEETLAYQAGFAAPYANDETRTVRGGQDIRYGSGCKVTPIGLVAIALSEGFEGERAVCRAIAIYHGAALASLQAQAGESAAKTRNEAAEKELRAEQIASARQKRAMGGA